MLTDARPFPRRSFDEEGREHAILVIVAIIAMNIPIGLLDVAIHPQQ
jgi:hypothetical protein